MRVTIRSEVDRQGWPIQILRFEEDFTVQPGDSLTFRFDPVADSFVSSFKRANA